MSTDVHTLSGAYALDALGPEEAAEFRVHLAGCQACRDEVFELREAAVRMGQIEATAPPAALKARVMAAVDRTPQLPPPIAVTVPEPREISSAPSVRKQPRWLPRVLTAAAAVILVGGGVAIVTNQNDEPAGLSPQAAEVFAAADAQIRVVKTENGGELKVGVSPSKNEMAVDTSALPELTDDEVYQLWAVDGGTLTSAGVLGSITEGAAMDMPAEGIKVAITVEPKGGSEHPSGLPIVTVDPAEV